MGIIEISIKNQSLCKLEIKNTNIDHKDHHPLLTEVQKQLQEYFSGQRKSFDLPLSPEGTNFQQRVWNALRTIPYGQTRTYGQLAHMIGSPTASRAVGQALNKNPLLIVVPCHRVLPSNGEIGGFACGVECKRALLEREGVEVKEG